MASIGPKKDFLHHFIQLLYPIGPFLGRQIFDVPMSRDPFDRDSTFASYFTERALGPWVTACFVLATLGTFATDSWQP